MRWLLALRTKVVGATDDPFAKVVLPDAIDHDARGQWIAWIGDAMGQFEPSAAIAGERTIAARNRCEEAAWHFLAEALVIATNENALVQSVAFGDRRRPSRHGQLRGDSDGTLVPARFLRRGIATFRDRVSRFVGLR